jgi:hypothetical protein
MHPQPWPPALRALLWMDAVLFIGVVCALAGKAPALHDIQGVWAWLALAGSTLTAALGVLAAFHLSTPRANQIWTMLPVPAIVLWISATLLGHVTMPPWVETWGRSAAEAGDCLVFLLATGMTLLLIIVFMLRRVAAVAPPRVFAMGAMASAGAAATLLTLVHPHAGSALDLCAHAAAILLLLGTGAAVRSCIPASA